ncbi:MAG: V-type ATP synthase subunit F, partial [Lachnospiraceae bacterium]|nr:V-type ATP synthase subunit F [Lachnospiraceae bacterium]
DGCVAHTKDEIKAALDFVLSDKNIGIVLITEKLSSEFPDVINDIKLNRKKPLLVEIPDRHGTGRRADFITSYVNEAIGLKL